MTGGIVAVVIVLISIGGITAILVSYFRLQRHRADAAAMASSVPTRLTNMKPTKTDTITTAALVTTPADLVTPSMTARRAGRPAMTPSRIRLTTNTWQSIDNPNRITNRISGIRELTNPPEVNPSRPAAAALAVDSEVDCGGQATGRASNGVVSRNRGRIPVIRPSPRVTGQGRCAGALGPGWSPPTPPSPIRRSGPLSHRPGRPGDSACSPRSRVTAAHTASATDRTVPAPPATAHPSGPCRRCPRSPEA